MLTPFQLRLISVVALGIAVILLLAIHRPRRQNKLFIKANHRRYFTLYYAIYKFCLRLPIIRRYVHSINERLSLTTSGDESDIIITTMRALLAALGLIVVFIIVSSLFISSWYLWGVTIILLYFVAEMTLDVFIGKIKLTLLEQLVTFIDYLRSAFLSTQMIDESYLIASDRLDAYTYRYLRRQTDNIYDVLVDSNGELALERYYHVAPNAYFKLLSGLSYIVKEHGDSKIESGSAFIKSLSHLSAEIKEDILRRKRLNFGLRAMNLIAISPVLIMQPIRTWASESFYPLKQFYQGPAGFVVEVIMFALVIMSCIIIRQIQRESVVEHNIVPTFGVEKYIYSKMNWIIDFFIPDSSSLKYQRIVKRQQAAHSFIKMPIYFTRKLISSVAFFLIAIAIVVVIRGIGVDSILNVPTTNEGFFVGEITGEALEKAMELTEFDNKILKAKHWVSEELEAVLEDNYQLNGDLKRVTLKRLLDKQSTLERYKLSPKFLILIYVLSLFGFWLPDILLIIRERLLKVDVELEISRFQLVVTMLMHVETMTVDQMLEWMEIFSHLFKRPIQIALMNYDAGAIEALSELKLASSNIAYQTLINHLISSVESLTIAESFSEFDTEKQYYQDKRALVNAQIVKKKIFLGQVVGFIPVYGLMVVYFMFPLVYASVSEMQIYFEKLQF